MVATRSALQLRLFETVFHVAADKYSTLAMLMPVKLLRFLEQRNDWQSRLTPSLGEGTDTRTAQTREVVLNVRVVQGPLGIVHPE
jgi:hypothetical protein